MTSSPESRPQRSETQGASAKTASSCASLSTRIRDTAAAALLFLIVLLVWSRPARWAGGPRELGRAVLSAADSDLTLHALPLRTFLFSSLRAGEGLPLWNPWWMGGMPVVETLQAAVFYPPVWLHAILPHALAANLLQLGHIWAAAMAMWLFLRTLPVRPSGACVGGLIYAFSGFPVLRVYGGHVNFLFAMVWIPLAAAALVRVMAGSGWRTVAWGGACCGLLLLCGCPQMSLMGALILGALAMVLLFAKPSCPDDRGEGAEDTRLPWRGLALAIGMGLLGAGLGAAQWLPAWAYLPLTIRTAWLDPQFHSDLALESRHLLGLTFPRLFGPVWRGTPWADWERLAPLGTVALVLGGVALASAGLGPFRKRGRAETPSFRGADLGRSHAGLGIDGRLVWFMGGLWVIFLVLAFGSNLPPYALAQKAIPLLQYFRRPGRFLFGVCFAGSVLAACGGHALEVMPAGLRLRVAKTVGLISAAMAVGCVLLFYPAGHDGDHWKWWTAPRLEYAKEVSPLFSGDEASSRESLSGWRAAQFREMRHDVAKSVALLAFAALVLAASTRFRIMAKALGPSLALLVAVDLLDYAIPLAPQPQAKAALWEGDLGEELRERTRSQWRVAVNRREKDLNLACVAGVRGAGAYEPAAPGDLLRLWRLDQGKDADYPEDFLTITKRTPFLNRWSVRWGLFSPGLLPSEGEGWAPRGTISGDHLFENPDALPRARFCAEAREATSAEEALLQIHRMEPPDQGVVFLSSQDLARASRSPASSQNHGSVPRPWLEVSVVEDRPEQVRLRGSFPSAGYVVLADTALPGWRAFVDGQETPILRADGVMRAVTVGEGAHEVVFAYRGTLAARIGRGVSLMALTLFLLLTLGAWRYNGRGRREDGNPQR